MLDGTYDLGDPYNFKSLV